jgi:hypothetical protein
MARSRVTSGTTISARLWRLRALDEERDKVSSRSTG